MQRNEEKPFERKSHFNEERNCYLDSDFNYVYKYQVTQKKIKNKENEKEKKECKIPYSEDLRDIFIFLDRDDHDFDLGDRYEKEIEDWSFQNRQKKYDNEESGQSLIGDGFRDTPINSIADPNSDVFDLAFPEYKETSENPMTQELREWISTLPESQQNLIFSHLGEDKFLEDIRREEEQETGKKITKQAMHNRWNKILMKTCKHFGLEKPTQKHCVK